MTEGSQAVKTDKIDDGTMKKIRAGGMDLLLARVGDKYYCVDNTCPHMGGDLSRGKLKGTIIECPLHHSQFDLADGHVIQWTSGAMSPLFRVLSKPRPLKTYAVRIEGDQVAIIV